MATKPNLARKPIIPVVTKPPVTKPPASDDGLTDDQRLAVLNGSLIPMAHPDSGTCDLYESDADGNILVPADQAAVMFDHGFVVVDAPAAD